MQKPHAEYVHNTDDTRSRVNHRRNIHIHKASTVCCIPDWDFETARFL